MCADYSIRPYEEWLAFSLESTKDDCENVDIDSARPLVLVGYFERFCRSMHDPIGEYSLKQIDESIWKSLCDPFWISDLVTDPELAVAPRESCIASMYRPFSEIVAKTPGCLDETDTFYMWWDIVCGSFCTHHAYFERAPFNPPTEDAVRIHDELLDTLERVLSISEAQSSTCALHGLGHICHSESARVVQQYIDTHKGELTESDVRWAIKCRDGTVL